MPSSITALEGQYPCQDDDPVTQIRGYGQFADGAPIPDNPPSFLMNQGPGGLFPHAFGLPGIPADPGGFAINDATPVQMSGNGSVQLWINNGGVDTGFTALTDSGLGYAYLQFDSGNVIFQDNQGYSITFDVSSIGLNEWYNLAISWFPWPTNEDMSEIYGYLNGVQAVHQTNYSFASASDPSSFVLDTAANTGVGTPMIADLRAGVGEYWNPAKVLSNYSEAFNASPILSGPGFGQGLIGCGVGVRA